MKPVTTRAKHTLAGVGIATLSFSLACAGLPDDLSAPSPLTGPARSGQPGIVMVQHEVTDPGMSNTLAATLLYPEGWTLEGGITRPQPAYYSNPVLADLTITGPDGRGVHLFPALSFEFSPFEQRAPWSATDNGNFWHPIPESVGQWLVATEQANAESTKTDVKLASETPLDDLTAQARQSVAPMIQQIEQSNANPMNMGVTQSLDIRGTEVVVTYSEGGTDLEETFQVVWMRTGVLQNGQLQRGWWAIQNMRSMRGPVGTDYLDDPLLHAVFATVRNDPRWEAEMARYWTELSRIRHQGNMARLQSSADAHSKRMKTLDETNDIIMRGFESRSAASDRMHDADVRSIHERTAFATESGQVELPSFYDNVYTDGSGRFLLHNDALHDPNTDPTFNDQDWQRLQPIR